MSIGYTIYDGTAITASDGTRYALAPDPELHREQLHQLLTSEVETDYDEEVER